MIQVKQNTIHTWIWGIVASLVLAYSAWASPVAPLQIHEEPQTLKLPAFLDKNLQPYPFDPSQNKLTVLHLWATWCVPCVKELPELDAFAAKHKNVHVIALALNKTDVKKVERFYKEHNITHLDIYLDSYMEVFRELRGDGLPTTVFIDKKGKEVARLSGPANWESDAISTFVSSSVPD